MDLGFNGRIALITGADSGIGFSTAEQLLAEGVRVVITDKNQSSRYEAAHKLGHGVRAFAADLTVAGVHCHAHDRRHDEQARKGEWHEFR
jgi:NAD(P)-dependent dehydrogenase (short-subunit alcohol dehydrogenase family)